MIYRRIARRYAAALFSVASAQGLADRVEEDLQSASAAIAADADLRSLLAHPKIPSPRKQEMIHRAFAGLEPVSRSFLALLVRRGRHAYLGEIIEEYRRMADDARGLVRAQVVSAVGLTEEQRQRLRRALEGRTGKTVEARYEVDPSLLAGLTVTMDDVVIDASARGRLAKMRELLTGARFRGLGQ